MLPAETTKYDETTYLVKRPVYVLYKKIPSELYFTVRGDDINDVWVEDFLKNETIKINIIRKSIDEIKFYVQHPNNIYSIFVRTSSPSSITYDFDFDVN